MACCPAGDPRPAKLSCGPVPAPVLSWRRLWQPRHPLFWLMLAFNGLSSLCTTALLALPLAPGWHLALVLVALGNVGAGMLAAWRLLRGD
jgi:4-hydroxybenzoate polyprenyltransferase